MPGGRDPRARAREELDVKPVRLWIGLVLLALGIFGILDATRVFDAGPVVGRWWPVAIIGLGLIAILTQGRVSFGPFFVSAVGLVWLADLQGWTEGGILWPTLLVIAGFAVLAGLRRHRTSDHLGSRSPVVVFGGTKVKDRSEHLTHADVSAIFGGATLDLREAHVDTEATVDAFALFGGVEVLVPKGWRVSVGGLPIMGGYEDKTTGNGSLPDDAPVLTVNATAIFGGVDVANEPQ